MTKSDTLLTVQGLRVSYEDRSQPMFRSGCRVQAVRGVDLAVTRGKCVGLVGESGCGKTSLARAVLGLMPINAGRILFEGHEITQSNLPDLRRRMQMIFQQSSGSMNPRMTVESIVGDPLRFLDGCTRVEQARRVGEGLRQVGLDDDMRSRFPHELSGGQLQRVAIARALVLQPKLLVCDEPVSALDVTAQMEILDHLKRIQRVHGLTILLITHDLDIAATMCDELAVMYLGKIVECGPTRRVIRSPQHPYTFLLKEPTRCPVGEPPSPVDPPSACSFHPRCPLATDACRDKAPALEAISNAEGVHDVACHHKDRIAELSEFTPSSGN